MAFKYFVTGEYYRSILLYKKEDPSPKERKKENKEVSQVPIPRTCCKITMHLNQAFKKVKQIWYFSMVKLKEYFRYKFSIFLWIFFEQNRSKIKHTKNTLVCQGRALCWFGMKLSLFLLLCHQTADSDSAFCWFAPFKRRIVSDVGCRVFPALKTWKPNSAQLLRNPTLLLVS